MSGYMLKPVAEIPGKSRGSNSLYGEILQDFANSSETIVEVIVEDRKPATVYQGLVKANRDRDLGIKVIQRAKVVYLSK